MTDTMVPYAMHTSYSRGRLFAQSSGTDVRNIFARDRDRVLHSTAFRRLKGKTQVFMSTQADHHRTRLTHTLEVSQIARTLARALRINEDLTEAIALAHDLGHPPYGHVGEDALHDFTKQYEGFNHNAQSLRIVTRLEHRYIGFDGLNLSWETLEGIIKHNGPLVQDVPPYIHRFSHEHTMDVTTYATLEAQVAAIADDVAYNNHDIDDGLRSGLIDVDDLYQVPHIARVIDDIRHAHTDVDTPRLVAELIRRLMTEMVCDIVNTTQDTLNRIAPTTVDDVRMCGQHIVRMSDDMMQRTGVLRDFLMQNVYRPAPMMAMRKTCKEKILFLMQTFLSHPHFLPNDILRGADDENTRVRRITDYVAGMTDSYADTMVQSLKTPALKTLGHQNRIL